MASRCIAGGYLAVIDSHQSTGMGIGDVGLDAPVWLGIGQAQMLHHLAVEAPCSATEE
jgi:hypothetical protein